MQAWKYLISLLVWNCGWENRRIAEFYVRSFVWSNVGTFPPFFAPGSQFPPWKSRVVWCRWAILLHRGFRVRGSWLVKGDVHIFYQMHSLLWGFDRVINVLLLHLQSFYFLAVHVTWIMYYFRKHFDIFIIFIILYILTH